MDKRIDELEEINLKVVDDTDGAGTASASGAALANEASHSATPLPSGQEAVQFVSLTAATDRDADARAALKHENSAESGRGLNSRSKPARFSKTTIRKTLVASVLVALLVAASNGLKSFWSSPISSQSVVFMGPSIFSAWCGEFDAANALQALPTMATEVSSTGSFLPARRRAAVEACLERFVGSTPVGKRAMSTVVDAVLLAAKGNPGQAVELLGGLDSDSPVVSGFHAAVLTIMGQYPAALETCDRGIRAVEASRGAFSPTTYDALWTIKAQTLIAMGRPDDALKVLDLPGYPDRYKEEALKRDSFLEARAAALLRLNQPDQAIIVACQMRRLNHMILSTAYLMKGDVSEAEQHAGKSYLALSKIYSQTGRLDQALKYAKLADQADLGVAGREQHVFVLNQLGRFREVIALADDLIALPKVEFMVDSIHNMPKLHADIAWAYANLGDVRQAHEHANWALHVDPGCRRALEAERLAGKLAGDMKKYQEFDSRLMNIKPVLYDRPVLFTSKNSRY